MCSIYDPFHPSRRPPIPRVSESCHPAQHRTNRSAFPSYKELRFIFCHPHIYQKPASHPMFRCSHAIAQFAFAPFITPCFQTHPRKHNQNQRHQVLNVLQLDRATGYFITSNKGEPLILTSQLSRETQLLAPTLIPIIHHHFDVH
jgi:hypothetical protein